MRWGSKHRALCQLRWHLDCPWDETQNIELSVFSVDILTAISDESTSLFASVALPPLSPWPPPNPWRQPPSRWPCPQQIGLEIGFWIWIGGRVGCLFIWRARTEQVETIGKESPVGALSIYGLSRVPWFRTLECADEGGWIERACVWAEEGSAWAETRRDQAG